MVRVRSIDPGAIWPLYQTANTPPQPATRPARKAKAATRWAVTS